MLCAYNTDILQDGKMDYRYGSHTVFKIEYHFVWVTKYRYQVLYGDVALRVRELVRQTCESFEIRIISGAVSKDLVHILVSAPPTLAPSEIMRRIKGSTVWRNRLAVLRRREKRNIRRNTLRYSALPIEQKQTHRTKT
jgi:putative transposase